MILADPPTQEAARGPFWAQERPSRPLEAAMEIPAGREPELIAILAGTFPAFRITRVPSGVWFATRLRPVTPEERARGLHYCLARPDLMHLIMALEDQVAIKGRHLPH